MGVLEKALNMPVSPDSLVQAFGTDPRASHVPGPTAEAPEDSLGPRRTHRDMYSILATWVDRFSDFQQLADFLCLKQLLAYMTLNMPCSDLQHGAYHLLAHLESSAIRDADPEG
ncbi:Ral guanine nucleotide dissociation stimulator [Tupaia chinensis]|uniref:Ral guanine nucleotide dissociation stimulator n=1 Tax=Tupaia chinensis TaxID=246437 RepID=L9KGT2_TUPCH|nr:Ral guanine nucleotide dissociation stimulator [Tupaia chinensis]